MSPVKCIKKSNGKPAGASLCLLAYSLMLRKCRFLGRVVSPGQAGGLPELSRWLSEAWRATPPEMNKERMHPGGMPETDGTPLASLRDAVISMLSSGGIGRFATLTTG
jgi:hypothetical protein